MTRTATHINPQVELIATLISQMPVDQKQSLATTLSQMGIDMLPAEPLKKAYKETEAEYLDRLTMDLLNQQAARLSAIRNK